MDCAICNSQIRPIYGRQGTKVTGVKCYALGLQGRHKVLDNSGGKTIRRTFEHCTLSTSSDEVTQLSVLMTHINDKVFHGILIPV